MDTKLKSGTARRTIRTLAILAGAGAVSVLMPNVPESHLAQARENSTVPQSIQLTATIRDFKARELQGGHTDFEWQPTQGFGHYIGQVKDNLDANGLPQFNSPGYKVRTEWRDAQGRNIMNPRAHANPRASDAPGLAQTSPGGSIHSADAFAQWYRDVPGVNASTDIQMTLTYDSANGVYVFDERQDPSYSHLGGFFPIDGRLFGNYSNTGHNYGFTAMIETEFVYAANAGYRFTFRGDDDVWVFVDGKLCIDLGGVHGVVDQTIELDRLNWLVDGRTYSLRFFFAERHTTESNFRIESTFFLNDVNTHKRPAIKGWEEVEPRD